MCVCILTLRPGVHKIPPVGFVLQSRNKTNAFIPPCAFFRDSGKMVVFSTIGAGDPLMVEPEGPHFPTISAGGPLMVNWSMVPWSMPRPPAQVFARATRVLDSITFFSLALRAF